MNTINTKTVSFHLIRRTLFCWGWFILFSPLDQYTQIHRNVLLVLRLERQSQKKERKEMQPLKFGIINSLIQIYALLILV